jgi:hypothetical protein
MSAPDAARSAALRAAVEALYRCADDILRSDGIEGVEQETVQRINTLGVKLFGAHFDNGSTFAPVLENGSVTATEASAFTSAILEVVNMDLFELSLWRQWGTS